MCILAIIWYSYWQGSYGRTWLATLANVLMMSVCPSARLSICLSVHLSVCSSVRPSIRLSVCLYVNILPFASISSQLLVVFTSNVIHMHTRPFKWGCVWWPWPLTLAVNNLAIWSYGFLWLYKTRLSYLTNQYSV